MEVIKKHSIKITIWLIASVVALIWVVLWMGMKYWIVTTKVDSNSSKIEKVETNFIGISEKVTATATNVESLVKAQWTILDILLKR